MSIRIRFIASGCVLALAVPQPALALRPKSVRESPAVLRQVRSGLEEDAAGAEAESVGAWDDDPAQRVDRELIRKVQEHDDELAMKQLVRRHQGLIHSAVRSVLYHAQKERLRLSYDDLLDFAESGFREAVQRFDLKRKTRLSTYVFRGMRTHLSQELTKARPISVSSVYHSGWLMRGYEVAVAALAERNESRTNEALQEEIERWVNSDPDKERVGRRLSYLRREVNLDDLAQAYQITYRTKILPEDRLVFDRTRGVPDLTSGEDAPLVRELLDRMRIVLSPEEGRIVTAIFDLQLEARRPNKQGLLEQADEGELILRAVSRQLGIEPKRVAQLRDNALRKMRAAVGSWLEEGVLTDEDLRDPHMRAYFLEEAGDLDEKVARIGLKQDGTLDWPAITGTGRGKGLTRFRVLFTDYLLELKDSPYPDDREDYEAYLARLTFQQKTAVLATLEQPDVALTELGKPLGVSKERARQLLAAAYGLATLLANARLDGPDSFAALLWRLVGVGGHVRPGHLAYLIRQLKIQDKNELLAVPRRRMRFRGGGIRRQQMDTLFAALAEEREKGAGQVRPAQGPTSGLEERAGERRDEVAIAQVVDLVRAARVGGQADAQERLGVVLDAAAAGDSALLPALVRRLARDEGLRAAIAVWDSDAAPERWGAAAVLRYPDDLGEWLRGQARAGKITGILFLGEGSRIGLVELLARGNGLDFRAEPPTLVKLLAAFVLEPLAEELAAELEETTGLGRQL